MGDHEWFIQQRWEEVYNKVQTEKLGEGAFGDVYKVVRKDNPDGAHRAVKLILKSKLTSEADKVALMAECDLMMLVGTHDNIVQLYEVFVTPTNYAMTMELMTGGDLFDQICEEDFQYDIANICRVVENCCKALAFMHSKGVGHRDIKPENIMLLKKADGIVAKLADFGFAKRVTDPMSPDGAAAASLMATTCGTPEYVAPEILKAGQTAGTYGVECDVWSMGVVFYTMLCGFNPFADDNVQRLFQLILGGKMDTSSEEWAAVSAEGKDLATRMMTVDPTTRIGAKEVLSHPYIVGTLGASGDGGTALGLVLSTAKASLNQLNNKRFKKAVRGVMLEHKMANHVVQEPAPEA